jgi:hypothetical protein
MKISEFDKITAGPLKYKLKSKFIYKMVDQRIGNEKPKEHPLLHTVKLTENGSSIKLLQLLEDIKAYRQSGMPGYDREPFFTKKPILKTMMNKLKIFNILGTKMRQKQT